MLFITPVTLYTESPVTLLHVGCTVLGAPWLRDCRGGLVADVWLDRLRQRFLRCIRLASTTQRMQFRGHSPRTIGMGAE